MANVSRARIDALARLEEDAAHWNVRARPALALFAAPLAGAVALVPTRLHEGLFEVLLDEDGVAEWATFAAYAAACPLAAWLAHRLSGEGRRGLAALYLVVAVGCFWVAGEEISWGQRLFGVETPEGLAEANRQGEFGLHNISTVEAIYRLVLLGAALYGSVVPWLARGRGQAGGLVDLLVPPLFLSSYFVVELAYRLQRLLDLASGYTITKLGEWGEVCFAAALLMFVIGNLRHAGARAAPPAAMPARAT